MFPLRILRVRGLAGWSAVRGFVGTGMYSTFLLGVLYLQHVHGYGALQTGLAFLPLTLLIGLFSLGVTARLMRQFGAITVVFAGLAAIAAALVLLARLPTDTTYFPAIATTALATIAAERTKALAGDGQHHLEALTGGFHLGWAVAAGAVMVGAVVALLSLRPRGG
jgi:hypothetical protein